jgi:phage terminase small subunit
VNTYPNLVLVGLLANQIDLYVQCIKNFGTSGLIESYNKGATFGPSPYITISDKALNRIIQLMKELGLTPNHRIGSIRKMDTESLEIEELFAGI